MTVQGDCTAERFNAKGGFTIGGLLNADRVEIALYGDCRAREIGGSSIAVTVAKHGIYALDKLLRALTRNHPALAAETIEGDDVTLVRTTAAVVRGKRVVLGPGCVVALVEYSESCEVAPDAQVERRVQVGGAAAEG